MNQDYLDPINSVGMPDLADSSFALDFLLSAKNAVRNCAVALTETITPEARTMVHNQLNEALALHEEVSQLMLNKGWLHPYHLNEQYQLDMKSAKTTVQIAQMELFPKDTARLGLFATPDK
ncbi:MULTISPECIES: spore coat protein [unclassified Paenibacillus]|uniref:spore coat protein n=1 Tax=unclassified Paenibacillus TaxID=185978 RepID=UPI001AE6DD71|nr:MULTISPECIES: spore coat protein [unclassified Paenibacillus]MBP1155603.1 spore coat protein CotF [Paenibacillus sp. PvP091]MBP1169011.1 spore coat protein CotF [Paenibacillus sp. PvR098]MBP2440039.1 spore coat protein CotF [Paenibacillus sp. PvP052]